MLFRRRIPPNFPERLRVWAWPRSSWGRSLRYFGKRILRLNATPHAVAAGVAAGVAISFTPLIGLHTVVALALAFVIRGNLIAAALGTMVGNPVVLPFLLGASYRLGTEILGSHAHRKAVPALEEGILNQPISRLGDTIAKLWPTIEPMLIGSAILGTIAGIASYFVVRGIVRAYRRARQDRLSARRGESAPGALIQPNVEGA